MAINMYESRRREIEDLLERSRMARNRDEHDYYRHRARELEREMFMRDVGYYQEPPRLMPTSLGSNDLEKPKAEDKTPISFLKSADTKLLLIGEMA